MPEEGGGAQSSVSFDRARTVMDRAVGARFEAKPGLGESGVTTSYHGTVLGSRKPLVQSNAQMNIEAGTVENEVYINGLQLGSVQLPIDVGMHASYAIPPINVKATVVAYPVGPVVVDAKAGFSLEGKLEADVLPFLGIPIEESSVRVHVKPKVLAQGYVEGMATLLAVRGGVGGAVTLIDADLDVYSQLYLGRSRPVTLATGHFELFSGKFYAFAELFNPLLWRWSRFLNQTLFEWRGLCYRFSDSLEVTGRCE